MTRTIENVNKFQFCVKKRYNYLTKAKKYYTFMQIQNFNNINIFIFMIQQHINIIQIFIKNSQN